MKVIAVRTDKPVYASNIYGGGVITLTATVQVDPGESGMYKLQAFIKPYGGPSNAWEKAGYEQWGKPGTTCQTGIAGIKTNCGDDVRIDISSPVGFGKHIVTVININEMNQIPGSTIDGVVNSTGAYATFEVLSAQESAYGLVKVFSNPSAAIITIDGIQSDRTTAAGASQDFALPAGMHGVTVSKMGYQTFRQDVVVPQRDAVQVYAKLVPSSSLAGSGASYAAWGDAYASFGDKYNLLPQPQQPANPMYAPSITNLHGRSYDVESTTSDSQDPLSILMGGLQSTETSVATAIAQYLPYILLAAGGGVLIYALSKPSIRKKATEYAARGGVATRAGFGGMKDVARAGYRGIKRKSEGASHEDIEYFLGEAAAKRAYPHMTREEAKQMVNVSNHVREMAEERPARVNGNHLGMTEMERITEAVKGPFLPMEKKRKIMVTLED